jgi:alpha-mannosidase
MRRGHVRGRGATLADLSEGGYGVSLLNDCKYGYDIRAT